MKLKFKVVSDSMLPLINIGDELTIKKDNQYTLFDIVVYSKNSKLIAHFVWRNQISFNQTLITRSLKDFYTDDEPVEESAILGVVTNYKISILTRIKILFLCLMRSKL